MTANRNRIRGVVENLNSGYAEIFDRRGETSITHFEMPFNPAPTQDFISSLRVENFTWLSNYKMWKLSTQHYGDPSYWWVIAWFNNKPTDAHFSLGDPVLIPFPLQSVLSFYGV